VLLESGLGCLLEPLHGLAPLESRQSFHGRVCSNCHSFARCATDARVSRRRLLFEAKPLSGPPLRRNQGTFGPWPMPLLLSCVAPLFVHMKSSAVQLQPKLTHSTTEIGEEKLRLGLLRQSNL